MMICRYSLPHIGKTGRSNMFELNDKVIIKKNNLRGTVIDVSEYLDGIVYTVESDTKGLRDDADYNIPWPEYECKENDIIKA